MKSDTIIGDSLRIMQGMPDKCIDLGIADPPYYDGYLANANRKNMSRNKIKLATKYYIGPQNNLVPTQEWFDQFFRVTKHQIIWGINYFVGSENLDLKIGPGRIVWDKVNGDSNFSDVEIAYCSMIESVRLFRYMWNGMHQGKSISQGHIMQGNKDLNEKRIHVYQKPVALYKWTINKFAQPGFKIMDPHLGSGSSRIAADVLGFDFLGIEIDAIHHADQEKRYQNYKKQITIGHEFVENA